MRYVYAFILSVICLNAGATGKRLLKVYLHPQQLRADTDTTVAPVKKQSVSVGVTAGSDASFFGRTSPKRYRYYTADLIYNAKSGFFAYGTIWKVSGSYPTLDEVDVGGGYVYHLWKNLSGSASYTHFFFNRDAQIIKSLSTNDLDMKATYDWRLFKSSMSFDYLFGKANDIFLTPSISRHIEPGWGVFDNKDYLTFTPTISMILGTQNFVEHYSNNEREDPNPDTGFGHDSDDLRTAHANRQFNVLNYSFKLPIAYNRPHYTFEVSTKYSIPVNVEGQLKNHKEVFLNLTFYYLFY
jgi:hypothetical protein